MTDTVAYCPAVLVSELLLATVTPEAADNVTWPAPFWTIKQLNPSPNEAAIVRVIALALFRVTTFPLSLEVKVYVVPVWSFKLASNPEIEPVPDRLPPISTVPSGELVIVSSFCKVIPAAAVTSNAPA